MFGFWGTGKNDGAITDREDIIKLLQMISTGKPLEFQPKFGQRQTMIVRKSSGTQLTLVSEDGETTKYVNTNYGTLLSPDNDGTEYGIEKVWPTDSMREMVNQMEA